MGKGLLFIVAGIILAGTLLMLDVRMAGQDAEGEQVSYEEILLAREIAQSAFDLGVSNIQRDFDWRKQQVGQKYQGGAYDLSATGTGNGEVALAVEGRYGKARVQITTKLVRRLDDFLEALNLHVVGVIQPKADNNMIITGNDTPPPSAGGGVTKIGTGSGPHVNAFQSSLKAVRDDVAAEYPSSRVYGAGGTGDFQWGAFDVDLDELYKETIAYPTDQVYTDDTYEDDVFSGRGAHIFNTSKVQFSNVTFGSSASPTVVRIYADEVIIDATTKGYGVLYVHTKKIIMRGESLWEGLVLVDMFNDKKAEVMVDKGQVFGSMVIRHNDETLKPDDGDKGLPGGHFDVDVFAPGKKGGMQKVYHQHQYDDKFDVTGVDLFSPAGCKINGGLCLKDLVLNQGINQVRVEFFNAAQSSGTYSVTTNGTTLTGNPADGLSTTLNPAELTSFAVNFDALQSLWATSPGNVQGDPANRNNAFTVRMYNVATSALIYELSVYEHGNRCNVNCGTDQGDDTGDSAKFAPLKMEFKGTNAGVFYSTKALSRLAPLLQTVAEKIQPTVEGYRIRSTDLQGEFSAE